MVCSPEYARELGLNKEDLFVKNRVGLILAGLGSTSIRRTYHSSNIPGIFDMDAIFNAKGYG